MASPPPPLAERSRVTTRIWCVLGRLARWARGIMRIATMAFIPDIRVVIDYGRVKSHLSSLRLCLGNTARAARVHSLGRD
ncbi:unnamed protein product [Sphagnum jensenii]|uniref:Uncharacterized protein n=1 Tax=Sphagnum jensenii TaxID=128206 RepID=A0ABP1AW83_9BRYO